MFNGSKRIQQIKPKFSGIGEELSHAARTLFPFCFPGLAKRHCGGCFIDPPRLAREKSLQRSVDLLRCRRTGSVSHCGYHCSQYLLISPDSCRTACGDVPKNHDFIVALNAQDFGEAFPSSRCGKTITMRRDGKEAKAVILDKVRHLLWRDIQPFSLYIACVVRGVP